MASGGFHFLLRGGIDGCDVNLLFQGADSDFIAGDQSAEHPKVDIGPELITIGDGMAGAGAGQRGRAGAGAGAGAVETKGTGTRGGSAGSKPAAGAPGGPAFQ